MSASPGYWAVVPAAGAGRRMGSEVPKQYLQLGERKVIEHTLGRLLGHTLIRGVAVAVSASDEWWPETAFAGHPSVFRVGGGEERCHSVLNALVELKRHADPDDWVLVHDAARPCLRSEDIDRLIQAMKDDAPGGLLAVPVHDAVKRSDEGDRVVETVPREALWRAYTPQVFRLEALHEALKRALAEGQLVTDDASAMELQGVKPLLVEGHSDNIKITRPEDLELAAFYLSKQG
ncbi:2-C-methyl-D-erythritol 4-phosphate cytidylyltransferase [Solemya velesiana gill symbiont]|uniref:2-C-methyl-D-erythritol 4-phosphate cytidylyltransferase n=1 Tax=Solemya velesiana gill symbiont TaxID=1918948 RepID=A0A1T2KTV4_9GAMM|nr:2-C-methyl-D-erythritol 4-phosphate cytidylyltransferase [Solemya velesiana gill symbiont]OOZ36264.1 2-C-methyl-D-erythritol 4-phosphate cytidylyltransferase [Solemya velesiana gill symbiont]